MTRLIVFALLLTQFVCQAQTNISVIYSFVNGLGQTQTVKQVSFTPLAFGLDGKAYVVGDETFRVITSASYTNPMLSGFSYRVKYFSTIQPPTLTACFTNSFSTNVTGTVYAADYTAISTNLSNGLYAYSMAASDALFASLNQSTNIALVAAKNATNGLPSSVWTLGTASAQNTNVFLGTNFTVTTLNGLTNKFSVDSTGKGTLTIGNTNSTSGGVTNAAVFNLPTNFSSINTSGVLGYTNFLLANPATATNTVIVMHVSGASTTYTAATNSNSGRGYNLYNAMNDPSIADGDVFFLSAGVYNINGVISGAGNGICPDLTSGKYTAIGSHLVGAGKGITIIDSVNNVSCQLQEGTFSCIRDLTFTNQPSIADDALPPNHASNNVYVVWKNVEFYQPTNSMDVFIIGGVSGPNLQNFWFENCKFVYPYDIFASNATTDTNSILVSHNTTYNENAFGIYPYCRVQYGCMARTCYINGDSITGTGGSIATIGIDAGSSSLTNSILYVWNSSINLFGSNVLISGNIGSFPNSAIYIGDGVSIDTTKINSSPIIIFTSGNSTTFNTSVLSPSYPATPNFTLNTYLPGNVSANGSGITNVSSINPTGTNSYIMGSTGYTNRNQFMVRIADLQGTGINYTNLTSKYGFSIGTILVSNNFFILYSNECLTGTGMSGKVMQ